MATLKDKTVYVCTECGFDSPKWSGKCPSCGEWNTMVEKTVKASSSAGAPAARRAASGGRMQASVSMKLASVKATGEQRISMQDSELDRVLGGGLVPGSLVLLGGEPGIGKSTLVLQTVMKLQGLRILYVSGEESASQLKMRADRINKDSGECYIVSETNLEVIFSHIKDLQPDIVIIDSIQTIFTERWRRYSV